MVSARSVPQRGAHGETPLLEGKGVRHQLADGQLGVRGQQPDGLIHGVGRIGQGWLGAVDVGPLDPQLARPGQRPVQAAQLGRPTDQHHARPRIGDGEGVSHALTRADRVVHLGEAAAQHRLAQDGPMQPRPGMVLGSPDGRRPPGAGDRGAQSLAQRPLAIVARQQHHHCLRRGQAQGRGREQPQRPGPDHQHPLPRGRRPGEHRVQRHAERLDQRGGLIAQRIGNRMQLAAVHDHGVGPSAGQVRAVPDQQAGRDAALGRPLAESRLPGSAAAAGLQASHQAADDRVDHHAPTVLLDHADDLVTEHRGKRGERRQDGAGVPGQQGHIGPAHAGQGGAQAHPVGATVGGWVVSVQLQPGHPAAGQARQPTTQQAERALVGGGCAEAQAQAASGVGHALGAGQSIGTWRTMLGPTRSRISSRLWPVMVSP
jgi:hypothetical protein